MKRQPTSTNILDSHHHQHDNKKVIDLENSNPSSTPLKSNTNSVTGPIKTKTITEQQKTPGNKRKALGDITNQEKAKTTQTNQQPTKKKKSELVDTKIINNSEQHSTIKQTKLQKPQFRLLADECEPIEFCPQAESITDFLEYPTPIFMEFNPETGKAEDVFVTLSDDKMKQLTKPPTNEGSSLPFDVCVDSNITGLPLPSPMPSAITPISFDDIFDVL